MVSKQPPLIDGKTNFQITILFESINLVQLCSNYFSKIHIKGTIFLFFCYLRGKLKKEICVH